MQVVASQASSKAKNLEAARRVPDANLAVDGASDAGKLVSPDSAREGRSFRHFLRQFAD